MTRLIHPFLVLVLAFGLSACNGDTPVTPSPSLPTTASFSAVLFPANEVPAITDDEKDGSAAAAFRINLTRNADGTITSATLDAAVIATGFPIGTPLTGAHIHTGAAGQNGGVIVTLGLAAGEITLVSGGGSFARLGITLTAGQATAIMANPGGFYFNIHTAKHLDGVARGQLTPSP